ncbi:hypothetical protein LCGC14_2077840 [marine sediment metagenome]|uniref:DNA-directed DNA polymerase family A palm domain-containing protein n=1 Tax=marine sediment metagenome TaxID=412755 RepID=A0A0F9GUV9_9ZZZZ
MKIATVDIETDDLLPEVTKVWCAVVKDMSDGKITRFTPGNINSLGSFLNTFGTLRGHNIISFDLAVLKKLWGYEYHGEIEDTLLMSRLQRPDRRTPSHCKGSGPHSVKAWGTRLGHKKIDHEEWATYSPEMLHRCEEDVEIQCKIYDALIEEGSGEGWEKAHKLNNKLFTLLQKQAEYGFLVDRSLMDSSIKQLTNWIKRIDHACLPHLPIIRQIEETKKGEEYSYVKKPFLKSGELSNISKKWLREAGLQEVIVGPFSRVSFRRVNLDSNLETKNFFLSLGWKPEQWNTNNAGQRTSPKLSKDDEFQGIKGGLGKLVVKRFQCKQRASVIHGWKGSIRSDGRIPAIVSGLAATGRARHKGIVNVPGEGAFYGKIMRRMFIAKPGWVLVGTDSVGNQVRQLAARMGDPEFSSAVLDPSKDVHTETQNRCGLSSRHIAKTFFYGLIFGSGNEKAGRIVGGSAEDGRRLKENVFRGIPALRECIERLTNDWRKSARKWYNKKYRRMEWKDGYIRGLMAGHFG